MVVNLPGLFGKDYLKRTDEQCKPFARELYKYCNKKGIDPREYVFDEMGMCLAGAELLGGMYADHQAHKKEAKATPELDVGTGVQDSYSRTIPKPEPIPDARPGAGQLITMTSEE